MTELADLQAEEDAVNREYRKLDSEYQPLREHRLELLKHREQLRRRIAGEQGIAVLPPKRAQTPLQSRIERCPRCTARLGFCPVCGAEFGAAA